MRMNVRTTNNLIKTALAASAITGISLIDDQIWKALFIVIAMASYTIVGGLFSLGLIMGRREGSNAYAWVFLLFVAGAYKVYELFSKLQSWIVGISPTIKIVAFVIAMLVTALCLLVLIRNACMRDKKNQDS